MRVRAIFAAGTEMRRGGMGWADEAPMPISVKSTSTLLAECTEPMDGMETTIVSD
jgi:hypothetical protein